MSQTMLLFIWRENILTEYMDGIVVAAAPDVRTARKAAVQEFMRAYKMNPLSLHGSERERITTFMRELLQKPEVRPLPAAAFLRGSS